MPDRFESLFELNAAVLRKLKANGADLGPSRSIDFEHIFPDQASADAFARDAKRQGFSTVVWKAEREPGDVERERNPWDATVSIEMTPTCENITETEMRLDILARSHGGEADGWGFWRV